MLETDLQPVEPNSRTRFLTIAPKVAMVVSLVPLGLFAFSLLARYSYSAEILGSFRYVMLGMLLAGLLSLCCLRRWGWAAIVVGSVAWCMSGVVTVYLPGNQPAAAGPQQIRVMSFNVWIGNFNTNMVLDRIRESDADLLMVSEYANHWSHGLTELDNDYPHRVLLPRWHGYGLAVFSKYPLSQTEVHHLAGEKTDTPMIVTLVDTGQHTFRLAAVHVISPTTRERLQIRNQQLLEAGRLLQPAELPTVVVGDFNCTPWSPFLVDLLGTTGLRDSRQGFGYQASWHTRVGWLRIPIDHAFVSDEIFVHRRWVAQPAGSDHYPIVMDFSISK